MPLVYDVWSPRAQSLATYLQSHMNELELAPNRYVVLGGDGFMLKTVRATPDPQAEFLGLNCGHLGFLLNDVPDDLATLVPLLRGPATVFSCPRLHMSATLADGRELTALAVNDIYLERMTGQSAHLSFTIDGHNVVEKMVSDGLILCTALGSTAYNFSSGASVCHPTLPVMGVTPICPHSPQLRSMYVPIQSEVVVEVLSPSRRPVRAVADGVDHDNVVRVCVRGGQPFVKFAFFPDHDFTRTLVRKLLA